MTASAEHSSRTLVFSVANHFYDRIYARCIASHRHYARIHGYEYVLVRKPYWTPVIISTWLKIPLLLAALENQYDWVVFLDADCEVQPSAPAIDILQNTRQSIFMGLGFSGNVNSGVIICRNTSISRDFFNQVLHAAPVFVPETDFGENGHVIHFHKRYPEKVTILERRWNNNAEVDLDDYIRHYSAGGPMRPLFHLTWQEFGWTLLKKQTARLVKLLNYTVQSRSHLQGALQKHLLLCQQYYPQFVSPTSQDSHKLTQSVQN